MSHKSILRQRITSSWSAIVHPLPERLAASHIKRPHAPHRWNTIPSRGLLASMWLSNRAGRAPEAAAWDAHLNHHSAQNRGALFRGQTTPDSLFGNMLGVIPVQNRAGTGLFRGEGQIELGTGFWFF